MTSKPKIFIIGLPRTGTTSISAAMLDFGFTVAHTAYTERTFQQAQVISDAPIFCDYALLDRYYPDSKFIYLQRHNETWLPSIKQLLQRMHNNLARDDGGYNPIIKRCFQDTFHPLTLENINQDEFLFNCYQQHHQGISQYFFGREQDLLSIDISQADSHEQLVDFVIKTGLLSAQISNFTTTHFLKLNSGNKVTAWKDLKHPNKIESTKNGRISTLNYLND